MIDHTHTCSDALGCEMIGTTLRTYCSHGWSWYEHEAPEPPPQPGRFAHLKGEHASGRPVFAVPGELRPCRRCAGPVEPGRQIHHYCLPCGKVRVVERRQEDRIRAAVSNARRVSKYSREPARVPVKRAAIIEALKRYPTKAAAARALKIDRGYMYLLMKAWRIGGETVPA